MSFTQATNGSSASSPASSSKKTSDVKCVHTTKGWVCAICFPLDDPNRALERVMNLTQLHAHAAGNHYAALGQNEWDNYVNKSVYYEAQFKGQRDLGLDGGVIQAPPTAASQKKLTKQAGVPKRKYVRKTKTVVTESALDLMESMINFDANAPASPGGSQDEDSEMSYVGSAPHTPHTGSGSYYNQSAHSQSGMGVSQFITTPDTHPSTGSYYDQSSHSSFGMDSMGVPQCIASPSTPSRKKSSASKNPLRQRLSENPSFESAVSVHGLDQVRAAGNAGLQRYLDRQARGLPRTANASLPLAPPPPSRNGTLGIPLTAANYAAAGMPQVHVEKAARRTKKVERRRQVSTTSSFIADSADGDAAPSTFAVTTNTSLNKFGVPATLFGQAPGAVYKSHAYTSIYAEMTPKEQAPLPEVYLPEIPSELFLPEESSVLSLLELAPPAMNNITVQQEEPACDEGTVGMDSFADNLPSEDFGTVEISPEQFDREVFGTSEPFGMGTDGANDFPFDSFFSEPQGSSENEAALGNAVPPMSNESSAEFLASISNPAASDFDTMFGFGNLSSIPSNWYENFTVFHTTSLEYGVAGLEAVKTAQLSSLLSKAASSVVEGPPSPAAQVAALIAGFVNPVELAPEVRLPSVVEPVAVVSAASVAETRVVHASEMAVMTALLQKQLEEQQEKFNAVLQMQLEEQKVLIKQMMEEQLAVLEQRARRKEARAAAAATAQYELLRLEARNKNLKKSNEALFGIVPGRAVGNGKPTVTTKDIAKTRVGPSKQPVPVKNHTSVVKEAVPAAKKASPGGQKLASAAKTVPTGGKKPVSATAKVVGVPSVRNNTSDIFSRPPPAGFKQIIRVDSSVKVPVNKPLVSAFSQQKATSTPAKPTVLAQSASAPKKRAVAPKPAPPGKKPAGVPNKGSSKKPHSKQNELLRARAAQKTFSRVNVPDGNGGWKWVKISEL